MTKTQLKTVVAIVLGAAVGSAVTVGGATAARGSTGRRSGHSIPIAKLTYGAEVDSAQEQGASAPRMVRRGGPGAPGSR